MKSKYPSTKIFSLFLLSSFFFLSCLSAKDSKPSNFVILSGESSKIVFQQCSRPSVTKVEKLWTPTENQIASFEKALENFVKDKSFLDYNKQYAGFIREGKKYIYLNALKNYKNDDTWKKQASVVCDGGQSFFGAEYEVEKNAIIHFNCNGSIAAPGISSAPEDCYRLP